MRTQLRQKESSFLLISVLISTMLHLETSDSYNVSHLPFFLLPLTQIKYKGKNAAKWAENTGASACMVWQLPAFPSRCRRAGVSTGGPSRLSAGQRAGCLKAEQGNSASWTGMAVSILTDLLIIVSNRTICSCLKVLFCSR